MLEVFCSESAGFMVGWAGDGLFAACWELSFAGDSSRTGVLFVASRRRIVAPRLYFEISSRTRFLSFLKPSRTASVAIGQSSISIVLRVPLIMKPMGGTSLKPSCSKGFFLALRLMHPGGPSKCGVILVRYPYCIGDPIVSPMAGIFSGGRFEKLRYAFSTIVRLWAS